MSLFCYKKTILLASLCVINNMSAMIALKKNISNVSPTKNDKKIKYKKKLQLMKTPPTPLSFESDPVQYFQKNPINEITLFKAIDNEDFSLLRYLIIDKKFNVNAQGIITGTTALHLATGNSNTQISAFLIEHKASINAQDNNGNTPLHYAVDEKNNLNFISLLLKHGANQTIKNKKGHRAEKYLHKEKGATPTEGLRTEKNSLKLSTHAALLCDLLEKLKLTDL